MTLCRNCEHESHCGKTCTDFVGIGMTDKYESCKCNYCRCVLCSGRKESWPGPGVQEGTWPEQTVLMKNVKILYVIVILVCVQSKTFAPVA